MTKIRTYSELICFNTFEERFHYLELRGVPGEGIFGFNRWVNQGFYRSREWKHIRTKIIIRDNGCDLAFPDYEVYSGIVIHHMNPMTLEELKHGDEKILDPEFLVTTSIQTHNAIHYGDVSLLPRGPIERRSGDTRLW